MMLLIEFLHLILIMNLIQNFSCICIVNKTLNKEKYVHELIGEIKNNKNFFIHTPSNWSKEGTKAGFKEIK